MIGSSPAFQQAVNQAGLAARSDARVLLIGDAAHATTPHCGQGAAQAIEELFGLPPKEVRVVCVGRIPARDASALGLHVDAP